LADGLGLGGCDPNAHVPQNRRSRRTHLGWQKLGVEAKHQKELQSRPSREALESVSRGSTSLTCLDHHSEHINTSLTQSQTNSHRYPKYTSKYGLQNCIHCNSSLQESLNCYPTCSTWSYRQIVRHSKACSRCGDDFNRQD
jgi:hypothetical protein